MALYLPTTVERLRETNNAGACYLQLVPAADIDTFPEEVRGALISAITLLSGLGWITVHPTKWTQDFDENWLKKDGATYSEATLACVIPKDRVELLYGLWQLHQGRFVVLHHDLNKTVKVLGSKEYPAMVNVVKLKHGSKPGQDRNQYELQVSVTRRTACPFYEATPPAIGVPGDCPTLAEQIAPLAWSAIEALLDEDQLAAAETSICEVPSSLCELIDEAIVTGGTPTNSFTTTGAGATAYNLSWTLDGTQNGKDRYTNGTFLTAWNGTAWVMINEAVGTEWYQSTDDTEFPWQATGWTAQFGIATPVPTLTQDGGAGGDVSAITDCLDTTQAGALLDGLLEDREWSDIEGRLSEEQLDAAEAALSSSLCEMLDAALASTLTNSFTTTGAGASEYNLSWAFDGTQNGKDKYTNGTFLTAWSGTAWVMINESVGTEFYQSTDDTEFPWEATGWTAQFGIETPVPTLTQDGGIDASAVVDCLDPLQAAAVVAALGGSAEPGTAQLVDSNGDPIGSSVSVPSGPTVEIPVPQSAFSYKDAANADQVSTPLDTVVVAGVLYADYQFPRRQLTLNGVGTGQYVTLPDLVNNTVPDIVPPLEFGWGIGDADTLSWTITSRQAGTYTTYSQDGGSGTITYNKNGAGFAALSGTITFIVGDTVIVRRTITTSAGSSIWEP